MLLALIKHTYKMLDNLSKKPVCKLIAHTSLISLYFQIGRDGDYNNANEIPQSTLGKVTSIDISSNSKKNINKNATFI